MSSIKKKQVTESFQKLLNKHFDSDKAKEELIDFAIHNKEYSNTIVNEIGEHLHQVIKEYFN